MSNTVRSAIEEQITPLDADEILWWILTYCFLLCSNFVPYLTMIGAEQTNEFRAGGWVLTFFFAIMATPLLAIVLVLIGRHLYQRPLRRLLRNSSPNHYRQRPCRSPRQLRCAGRWVSGQYASGLGGCSAIIAKWKASRCGHT